VLCGEEQLKAPLGQAVLAQLSITTLCPALNAEQTKLGLAPLGQAWLDQSQHSEQARHGADSQGMVWRGKAQRA
jgi:hypothetical protein